MEEIKKLTKEEEMDVGRQIYDRLLTIPIAAEKFGVTYSAARRWLRAYRAANGLPPSNGGFSKPAAVAAAKADIGALDSMTRDQLIDEVIRARADAERAKKGTRLIKAILFLPKWAILLSPILVLNP